MKRFLMLLALLPAWALAQLLALPSFQSKEKESASRQSLFEQYRDRIVQVRSINQATGQKGSIGSGFVIGDGRFIATNYHVIANVVSREGFVADYLNQQFQPGSLKLRAIDVINDLAILEAEEILAPPLKFAREQRQGEALFSLGNPSDYGFVIVEGSNNGFQQNTAYPRLLFSGAINQGMSGGPTLNAAGEVVGINVATQGNGLGFIVPVDALEALWRDMPTQQDFAAVVAKQIAADNERYYQRFFDKDFKISRVAKRLVPTEFGDDLRCWDNSPESHMEDLMASESLTCLTDREIFLNDNLSAGQFIYQYNYYYSREALSSRHFYRLYSDRYQLYYLPHSSKYYGDFSCRADFVWIGEERYKLTYCIRPSRLYQGLVDVALSAAAVGSPNEGFMIQVALVGIQEDLAKKVLQRLLGQIKKGEAP